MTIFLRWMKSKWRSEEVDEEPEKKMTEIGRSLRERKLKCAAYRRSPSNPAAKRALRKTTTPKLPIVRFHPALDCSRLGPTIHNENLFRLLRVF